MWTCRLVVSLTQIVKDVGDGAFVVAAAGEVHLHIAVAEVDGFLGDINRLYILGAATEGSEGEASSIAKTVEDTVSTSEILYEFAVLTLVDEKACLLPFEEVDKQAITMLER